MSAGICIMNRNAIAMAADSAVTVGNHEAIHNSANKLFSLSRIAPVGAIIYSNTAFMGVPFEIILKEYKKFLGNSTFDSLNQYFEEFISFLLRNSDLFRFPLNEENFVMDVFQNFVAGMIGDYLQLSKRKQQEKGSELTDSELKEIAKDTVNLTIQLIDSFARISNTGFAGYIRTTYKMKFIDLLRNNKNFSWLNIGQIRIVADKICEIFDTKFERNGYVGFAIAGYGETEIYPSLIHIHLTGFIDGAIRYFVVDKASINENMDASVVPLAQTDVMQTFLFGMNDKFLGYLAKEIPIQISASINKMDNSLFASNKRKQIVLQQLTGITGDIINHMKETAVNSYMLPIYQSLATLPIEELGLLAESMINITSIRRKVALDSNIGTVGGPIDVAIVSKGDGFIWLKRKHYFEKKFNPQFFYSHYQNITGGDQGDD